MSMMRKAKGLLVALGMCMAYCYWLISKGALLPVDQQEKPNTQARTQQFLHYQEELLNTSRTASTINTTAIPCGTKRIAVVGSSHARSFSFSLVSALTGQPYPNGDEVNIPLFDGSRNEYSNVLQKPINNVCTAHTGNHSNSCDLPEYQELLEAKKACRYTFDAGVNVENCGYPFRKHWLLAENAYQSTPSVAMDAAFYSNESSAQTQLLFHFKTFIYTPDVDRMAGQQIREFNPDLLILDFTMWGCRVPSDEELATGRMGWPQDEARNCTADVHDAVVYWDNLLLMHIPILHFVNTYIVDKPIEHQTLMASVQELQTTSSRIHLLIDKGTVIYGLRDDQRSALGHGYLGLATDIWARAALGLVCGDAF